MQIKTKQTLTLAKSLGFCSLDIMAACSPQAEEAPRPNIIFIMSDDHAWQVVSAYNERLQYVAPTPNIDRIARDIMLFERCLVTNSICGPSRAAFLTDQGHYYNPTFINAQGTYDVHGYVSDIITDKTPEWLRGRENNTEPFMVMMHHKAPHREWEPGHKYLNRFQGVDFPEPFNLFDDYSGMVAAGRQQDISIEVTMRIPADLKMWPPDASGGVYNRTIGRMDEDQRRLWDMTYEPIREEFERLNLQREDLVRWKYQRYMYDYLATIQSIDESVGRTLQYLEETGMDENTIVIYTSDQGFYLGEYGWFDKRFMYEESYRTPLVVKWPGHIKPGSVNKNIVSNLDFAGAPDPSDMQGRSMLPLLRGECRGLADGALLSLLRIFVFAKREEAFLDCY